MNSATQLMATEMETEAEAVTEVRAGALVVLEVVISAGVYL